MKMAVLAVAVLFAVGATCAFADDGSCKKAPCEEKSLFNIVKDTIKPGPGKEKNKVINPLPTVTTFQAMADGIKEGSAKARSESLRNK
jgi:hypothetical protein